MQAATPIILINVSGPYGVGKDTMIQALLDMYGSLVHRVSTVTNRPTSRSADPTYRTVDRATMEGLAKSPDWIVTRQFGGDVLYGTSIEEIRSRAMEGRICSHAIFAGADGAGRLREVFGSELLSIGLLAANGGVDDQLKVLRERLVNRSRDDQQALNARLAYQADPIRYVLDNGTVNTSGGSARVFDEVIVNDDATQAIKTLMDLVDRRVDLHQDEARLDRKSDRRLLVESLSSGYAGGSYYNPASDLTEGSVWVPDPEAGRPLVMNLVSAGDRTYSVTDLYRVLSSRLSKDELLFGMYARGGTLIAPFIWNAGRLLDFEREVDGVNVRRIGFYGVARARAEAVLARESA